ncbi:hypothetical protein [Oceanospirillum linum]|uniref:Uncharacterized protein n=1 Tax=Oceanospirillum linum TaxID=966 RepID=A0A1T1H8Q4_OCELI|nr:hypothetical protein [Oceanospirillum linum]OOV86097.1 hypothetical protein BTA35_0215280 [Oceanospirillum linum]SEG41979.1 hypothetical protein SAMN04489856_11081 [Oleiphilus messinensis]SMP33377.1 hypothetical protein SAMN06264348_11052 [Oceanospirillum linum]
MFRRLIKHYFALVSGARLAVLVIFYSILAGCSTYGDSVQEVLDEVRRENYAAADDTAQAVLSPSGSDRLLYFLERGMIAHLDGRYQESNSLLEQAYRISESLYRSDLRDWLAVAMTHPGNASYRGQLYERVYLHYIKMLNYLMLAQQQNRGSQQEQLLDSARVENRRIQILLDENVFITGDYSQAASAQEKLFSKIAKVFRQLNGDPVDPDELIFRDQAFAHYVMGALYEQYGELDNARISYQRSATLYEDGYTKQYGLDTAMTVQAWSDVVRVMQKAGGYEEQWRQLVKSKSLPSAESDNSSATGAYHYQPEKAELLILQHVDLSPQRKVLNMHLMINSDSRQLVVRPIPVGSRQEQREQAAWFYLLYADKGLYNVVRDFSDGSILNSEGVLFNSRATTLQPVWSLVEDTGLDYVLGNGGVRIAVPYYPIPYAPLQAAEVNVSSEKGAITRPMIKADSVAMLGLLQQALEAQAELNSAMAREVLRNKVMQEAVKDMGALGALGGKLLAASTTNADTRSWLSLPHHIRVQRLQLEPGGHTVVLNSRSADGQNIRQEYTVDLKAGELEILTLRTFLPLTGKPD